MGCVPAPSCRQALNDASSTWPGRNRSSDGICGDASHQAKKSDHNSGNAFDLTHDPLNGPDCHDWAEAIKASGDPRVKYIIWNHRIWNPSISSAWRPYGGSNPHTQHMHVSIHDSGRDDLRSWPWSSGAGVPEASDMFEDQDRGTLETVRAQNAALLAYLQRPQVDAGVGALFANGTEHKAFVTPDGHLQRWVWRDEPDPAPGKWVKDLDVEGFDPESEALIRNCVDGHGRWLWHEVSARTPDGKVGRVLWAGSSKPGPVEIIG